MSDRQSPLEDDRVTGPGRTTLAVLRVLVAALLVAAVLAQLGFTSVPYWRRLGLKDVPTQIVDYFSAFTHDVALAAAVVLVIGAVQVRRRAMEPVWLTRIRLCVLVAIILTGVVYNVLLRPLPVPVGSQLDWANETVHVIGPIAVLLDWLIAPGRARLKYRAAWLGLAFPIVWVIYTFIRGPLTADEINRTAWYYPYPFLDPHGAGGWTAVLTIVGVLVAFVFGLGILAVLAGRGIDRSRRPA